MADAEVGLLCTAVYDAGRGSGVGARGACRVGPSSPCVSVWVRVRLCGRVRVPVHSYMSGRAPGNDQGWWTLENSCIHWVIVSGASEYEQAQTEQMKQYYQEE